MYSKAKDIRLLLGDPTEQQVPGRVIAIMQRKASSRINGMVRNIYGALVDTFATLNPIPPQLVGWEEDLAIYFLSRTHYFKSVSGVSIDEVTETYDKAMADLRKVAERKMQLDGVVRPDRSSSTTDGIHQVFDIDTELQWGPDPDKICELREDRDK